MPAVRAPSIRRPMPPPHLLDVLDGADSAVLMQAMQAAREVRGYPHWDRLRHLTPPAGLTVDQWWGGIKLERHGRAIDTPLATPAGVPFTYAMPDEAQRMVHLIDQRAGGRLGKSELVTNPAARDRYVVSSMIEEAITSSQLEGATTSRAVAKQMIRSGRAPATRSEQMILNNYRAMEFVRQMQRDDLTPDVVLTLHRIVTEQTLERPEDAGRLQLVDDQRVKVFAPSGDVLHDPPAAELLPDRMRELCRFANGAELGAFLHPVVRAIIVHFWIGYDHPFADGNGRTARALFYWAMMHQGYWLSEHLAVSSILRKAPSKYAKSYLYVESDENDLTYFVLYQLEVICRALDAFDDYVDRKVREVRQLDSLLQTSTWLNHRQTALLAHALRHPGATYTYVSHATSHRVVHQTARTDLLGLADAGLLLKSRRGNRHVFSTAPDLVEQLAGIGT